MPLLLFDLEVGTNIILTFEIGDKLFDGALKLVLLRSCKIVPISQKGWYKIMSRHVDVSPARKQFLRAAEMFALPSRQLIERLGGIPFGIVGEKLIDAGFAFLLRDPLHHKLCWILTILSSKRFKDLIRVIG